MAEEKGFKFWQDWLRGVCIAIIVVGIAMALLIGTGMLPNVSGPFESAIYSGPLTAEEENFRAWAYGAWGATMAGWGIVLLGLVRGPFARKEMWAWRSFTTGLLIWFVIDTGFSVNFGVWYNVSINVAVLALALLPLVMTYKAFRVQ